jgi:N6-L-threonylcarbamoyladenine synthase
MIFLGIETSCDETAAAIVRADDGPNAPAEILSNIVLSQTEDHAPFGGVVPEIAARAHLNSIENIVQQALSAASVTLTEIDGIAVTTGPGLAGGLIVGTMVARSIAMVHQKPIYTINHLEGHALTARLTDNTPFPYLLLLVSGGHTQILLVKGVGDYERWATTIDDALGEAFDKTAKLLGLPYPGGPEVEKAAETGNPNAYEFPRPLKGRDTLDMSFSGLKTAVRKAAQEPSELNPRAISNICASFQNAVADVLENRLSRAMSKFSDIYDCPSTLVVAGGVAANTDIRTRLQTLCATNDWNWVAPPHILCTDNAAMIAWAGLERHRLQLPNIDAGIKPRWPLDQNAVSKIGSGRKGAKA